METESRNGIELATVRRALNPDIELGNRARKMSVFVVVVKDDKDRELAARSIERAFVDPWDHVASGDAKAIDAAVFADSDRPLFIYQGERIDYETQWTIAGGISEDPNDPVCRRKLVVILTTSSPTDLKKRRWWCDYLMIAIGQMNGGKNSRKRTFFLPTELSSPDSSSTPRSDLAAE